MCKKAELPKELMDKCYVTENGMIFTPIGEKTAEEVYNEWKDKQIDICPTKTTEEKLEELIGQVSLMDELIANLTLEVVENE